MPKEWADNYEFFNYKIDPNSLVSTKNMPKVC